MQQPYGQQQYGGFGPSTPPPPSQTPMGQYAGSPYGQQGTHTPPPYTLSPSPSQGGGGRKSNTGAIVGAAIGAVVVVAAVIIALVVTNGNEGGTPQSDDKPSATAQAPDPVEPSTEPSDDGGGEEDGDFKPEDKSKTIESTRCTNASDSYTDKGKKIVPDFTYKNLASVKKCIREAGWKLGEVATEDENIWGKNMVLEQSPEGIDSFDPKKDKIELTVSTGKPGD